MLSKSRGVAATLRARDKTRYRSQLTLLANRIKALRLASTLLARELAKISG